MIFNIWLISTIIVTIVVGGFILKYQKKEKVN